MNEYEALLNELNELEKQLNPPQKEITEAEHVKASVRFAFEELFSYIYSLEELAHYYLQSDKKNIKSPAQIEHLKKNAKESLQWLENLYNDETNEPWEHIVGKERFEYIKEGLTSSHLGDCTAVACSCTRCLAETLYKIPRTVNWGKSVGSKMLGRYNLLKQHQKIIENANNLSKDLTDKNAQTKSKNKI